LKKTDAIIEGVCVVMPSTQLLYFFEVEMKESKIQKRVRKALEDRYPNCIVLKNDPTHYKSIFDLTFLYHGFWAGLETKREENSPQQSNQNYYVDLADQMSFGAFINDDNFEEVLRALEQSFLASR
jgi:hypothetical protein